MVMQHSVICKETFFKQQSVVTKFGFIEAPLIYAASIYPIEMIKHV